MVKESDIRAARIANDKRLRIELTRQKWVTCFFIVLSVILIIFLLINQQFDQADQKSLSLLDHQVAELYAKNVELQRNNDAIIGRMLQLWVSEGDDFIFVNQPQSFSTLIPLETDLLFSNNPDNRIRFIGNRTDIYIELPEKSIH